jgi:hypothetical protein
MKGEHMNTSRGHVYVATIDLVPGEAVAVGSSRNIAVRSAAMRGMQWLNDNGYRHPITGEAWNVADVIEYFNDATVVIVCDLDGVGVILP